MSSDEAEKWAYTVIQTSLGLEKLEKIPTEYLSQYQALVEFKKQILSIEVNFNLIFSKASELEEEARLIKQNEIN